MAGLKPSQRRLDEQAERLAGFSHHVRLRRGWDVRGDARSQGTHANIP